MADGMLQVIAVWLLNFFSIENARYKVIQEVCPHVNIGSVNAAAVLHHKRVIRDSHDC